jgi:hypothetical protein
MTDGSKHRPNITAGVDTGDKHSYLCLLDTASGEVMEEGRLRTTNCPKRGASNTLSAELGGLRRPKWVEKCR